jgi:hypothetical protein
MKLKSILLTAATLGLTAATMAQVPNYLPTNGLVGWWPFNGNANDESGNGNNGTINGATQTTDRFGISNAAFDFDGVNDFITTDFQGVGSNNPRTITFWASPDTNLSDNYVFSYGSQASGQTLGSWVKCGITNNFVTVTNNAGSNYSGNDFCNSWHFFTISIPVGASTQNQIQMYVDGLLINNSSYFNPNTTINTGNSSPFQIGRLFYNLNSNYFHGKIDDIGFWNRTLTQQEITDLFNAVNCANNTAITPQTNYLATGSTASFTASTTDPSPSYIWQSDLGQGFQTLNNYGNYSGVNTNSLSISNVQLPNHTQQIRVISTSDNCIDTSNVALINILDTCIVTVYDTLLTTVTDTLIINATITGINPPNSLNTLKVFPSPANTHITIDYGNFNAMSGYTLTIVNSIGQTVFTTPINQQTSYIDLSTWTGNGIYFVQIIDPQNNTIENRKIVIQ